MMTDQERARIVAEGLSWPSVEWEEGYPTAEDDEFLTWDGLQLDFQKAAAFVLHELPSAAENCCASCAAYDSFDAIGRAVWRIEFSTGGWSGAESLMSFIRSRADTRHFMESWKRGGHYVFEIPERYLQASPTREND